MNSRTGFLLLLGLCLVALVFKTLRVRTLTAQLQQHRARADHEHAASQAARAAHLAALTDLDRVRAETDSLRQEMARLRGRATADQPPSSPAGSADATEGSARSAQPENRTRATGAPAAAMRSYVDSRINLARERLNLTPAQEETIRTAVDQALQTGLENLRRIRAGETTFEEVPTLQEWSKALEDQILASLSSDQQAAYQRQKQEEQRGNARMAANTELLLLQGSLGLTPEQQDSMFAVLYEQSIRNQDLDPATLATRPRDPVAALDWEASQKRQALQGILTPAQMANYERLQNGYRDGVSRFLQPNRSGQLGPPSQSSSP